jgi:hypothetical protein
MHLIVVIDSAGQKVMLTAEQPIFTSNFSRLFLNDVSTPPLRWLLLWEIVDIAYSYYRISKDKLRS